MVVIETYFILLISGKSADANFSSNDFKAQKNEGCRKLKVKDKEIIRSVMILQ